MSWTEIWTEIKMKLLALIPNLIPNIIFLILYIAVAFLIIWFMYAGPEDGIWLWIKGLFWAYAFWGIYRDYIR